jgi:hypothetical protein
VARTLKTTTGELTEIERLMVSSERGGWKSAHRGNSLAAYSTARSVLRGEGDSNVFLLPDRFTEDEISAFVSNGDGKDYSVTLTAMRSFCGCRDSMFRGKTCKHTEAHSSASPPRRRLSEP